jgi:YYY domain-containing protein
MVIKYLTMPDLSLKKYLSLALLALIVLVGAALRFYNLDWDSGHLIHPDERFIVMVADTLSPPADLATALDPRQSPLNPYYNSLEGQPRHFAYGDFPLYLLYFLAEGLARLAPLASNFPEGSRQALILRSLARINEYGQINLLGRALSALFDSGTIIFVYLLGRRLYGRKAGLLAAAFVAFAVLHVQLAHFYAFDVVMAFFAVAAIYFDVRLAQEGEERDIVLAGLCTGLAVGSKFSALPLLLPLAAAHFLRALSARNEAHNPPAQAVDEIQLAGEVEVKEKKAFPLALFSSPAYNFLLSLAVAFLAFAVTNPFALLDFGGFLSSISYENEMVRGVSDLPYTRQYRHTLPYLYHIENQLRYGMGLSLGLAGFGGLAWAVYRFLRRRASYGEIVVLSWVVPYFLVSGSFMVKYMRYMVLVVPFLCVFGAGMLLQWVKGESGKGKTFSRLIAGAVIAATLLTTILWCLAFMQIYTTPLTRVRASEWIYRNVPKGSALTAEEWDDRLPFDMKVGSAYRNASEYRIVKMALQEPDDYAKFEMIRTALQDADYVVISSNRFYGWLPRLRDRYPITNRYYDLLFAGELGFELAETFTSYPRLDGLAFNDDRADESFTVYDHPKVLIFRKTRELPPEEMESLFRPAIEQALRGEQIEERQGKDLMLDQPVDTLPIVDDYRWNRIANNNHALAVVMWWAVVEIIGLLAWPLAATALSRLADKGYGLSKSLGLLLVGYIVWIGASLHLGANTLPHALTALAAVGVISAALLWRESRQPAASRTGALALWQNNKRLILVSELLFSGAFLGFVGLRVLNPDLWQPWNGGEKMMEMGFLNATLKSAHLPPYDPYFAGGYINYYYYGYFLVGLLIKLTGIKPSIAFNLAVPTLAALSALGAFSIGYNLAAYRSDGERLLRGALAAFFVVLIGNPAGCEELLDKLGEAGGSDFASSLPLLQPLVRAVPGLLKAMAGQPLPSYNYWNPTRVIPGTINEFPYFSFIFADLHPHMMGIPFTLLMLGLALNLLLIPVSPPTRERGGLGRWWVLRWPPADILAYALLPLCLGAFAVINTWDLPTYLGLASAVFLLRRYRASGQVPIFRTLAFGALLIAGSMFLYWPFFHFYQAYSVGVGLVADRTSLGDFLSMWGFFLFVLLTFVLAASAQRRFRWAPLRLAGLALRRWQAMPRWTALHQALVRPSAGYLLACCALVGLPLVAILLLLAGFSVPALLVIPLGGSFLLLLGREERAEQTFTTLLVFTGLLILFGCEIIFLRDWLGASPNYRMNTLFKFYIQVWGMFGIAAAVVLPALWGQVNRWRSPLWRIAWQTSFTALLFASLVYIVLGTRARVQDRFINASPPIGTLDGLAYMTVGSFTWPDGNTIELKYDYEAIRWLLANVQGTPVVAEAAVGYYREGGMRVSSYTGFPMPLGGLHQNEQRPAWQIGQRDGLVREFYNTPDVARGLELIEQLDISYLYVGPLERVTYPAEGLGKLEQMAAQGMLSVPFRNERVTIYKVERR